MVKNFISVVRVRWGCMIEATPWGNNGRFGYGFKDLDLGRIRRDGTADKRIDPVDRWWLDA